MRTALLSAVAALVLTSTYSVSLRSVSTKV